YRTPVHVAANGFPRLDKRAEVAINFTALFNAIGQPNGFNRDSLRVVEVNSSGQVTDANVPFVFANGSGYNANSNAHGLLTIQMKGSTAANGVRYYQVYWDTTAKSFTPPSHSVPADIEPIPRPLVVWQGGAQTQSLGSSPNGPNTTFKVTTSAELATTFEPGTAYVLNTSVVGAGVIERDPPYPAFAPGDGVVLTATAEAGWAFVGWSGDASGDQPVLNLVMDQAKSITASFKEIVALNLDQVGQGQVTVDPQKGQYLAGDEVTLTASAAKGWVFTGWSGAVMSEEAAITLTLDADTNLTATFTAIRKLTVETQGQGQVTVEPTPAFYLDGDEVTLTATAEAGWVFAGWGGDVTGEEATITVTLDADKSVTATFLELHTLTTEAVGQGTVVVSPDQADYVHGTAVTLTAVAEAGWAFVGWGGDLSGDANPGTLTMDADKSVTATFAPLYPLTVTVVGEGGAVERTPDQAEYVAGAQVTLTATAAPGWRFTGWSGDAQGSEASVIVTMDSAKAVTATFVEEEYALTLTPQGQGTLTADPVQPFYRYGDEVTLTATPTQGWFFMGWGGDATGSTNPLTIVIDGDKSVTAQFADVAFTLTANITGGGEVVVTPNLPHYAPGAQVAVEARPEAGWLFMGWSGDLTGNTNPATLIMDGNKSITANFMTEGGRTLAVTVMPQGGGTVTRNPNLPFYENNQTVTLTAQPAEGWFFTGWSGDLSGVNNPATLLMNGNKNVVAHFSKDPLTLAVQVNGRGDVVVTPKKAAYEPGETVTLLAVPDLDSAFHGWGGDASGNANPLTLVMNGAKTVVASFIDVDLPPGVVSDSFNRCALNQSAWRFANPAGDGAYALNGKQLLLSVPGGAEHMLWTTYGSPALLQKVGNGNFQLEVKFDSPVEQRFQVQGIVAQADEENWLRANVQSDGNVTTLFVGRKQAGDQPRTVAHIELPNQQPPYYLRMTRTGDRWTVSHSSDGANWLTDDRHNNFKLALAVDEVGLFVGNATTQNGNPTRIPAHTAVVDYFRNTAAPATAIADVIPNHRPVMVQGRGVVNKNPLCGSPTTLTAVGDPGWSFVGWSGAASGDAAETQVSFGAGDVVTATFTAAQYTVAVDVVGEGAVEVSPA
ncbi:MAG: DUF1349 domain-containing protein, partial [Caldilineaceae bacterium]|nr:DUF1349 domain-containing protein [Caldilineaceae bacterium]